MTRGPNQEEKYIKQHFKKTAKILKKNASKNQISSHPQLNLKHMEELQYAQGSATWGVVVRDGWLINPCDNETQ